MANSTLSETIPADMEVTPERALMIKRALLRQYAHQYNLDVTGWDETLNGVTKSFLVTEKAPA